MNYRRGPNGPERIERGETGAHGDAVMSFKQIGEALGITRGGAWMAYKSAIRKLRKARNARILEELQQLAAQRRRIGERE
jgi:hypothetical protein